MKNLIFIFILALLSCKNEKTQKKETESEIIPDTEVETTIKINPSVSEMWNNYIDTKPEFKNEEIPDSDFFHNNPKDADRLAELTIIGKKRASSGLYSLYQQYNIELPTVGTKQIVTDFDGNAKAIIENIRVDTVPFNKITAAYAQMDMGTDVNPLEKWKKAHWDFFENFLKESGGRPTEDMIIVCVEFKTIWPNGSINKN